MNTYKITENEFSALTRMIDFAEYWLQDRESGNEQWRMDNEDVMVAVQAMQDIIERTKNEIHS
jgi:hypothetical protein